MTEGRREERGRPALGRERIVRAALDLIDRDGLDRLTMRRLGAELGVEAMALYKHVAGKDAILDGVRGLLVAELAARQRTRGPFAGWREHLEAFALSHRAVALAHPGALPLLAHGAERAYAAGRDVAGAALDALVEAGFDRETAIAAERTVARHVLGFGLIGRTDETAAAPLPEEEIAALAGERPLVGRLVRSLREADEALFRFGLDLILDGLARRLPAIG